MSTICGDFIKQKRIERGITQEELADKIGISQKSISKFENGLEEPKISVLCIIAKVLGCETSELINSRSA